MKFKKYIIIIISFILLLNINNYFYAETTNDFTGFDDCVNFDYVYEKSPTLQCHSYNSWDVKEASDLSGFNEGYKGASRYVIYKIGSNFSTLVIKFRAGTVLELTKFKFYRSETNSDYQLINSNNQTYINNGADGSSYQSFEYYLYNIDSSYIKIEFPSTGLNWWDCSILSVSAYTSLEVNLVGSYFSNVSEFVYYGKSLTLSLDVNDGYKFYKINNFSLNDYTYDNLTNSLTILKVTQNLDLDMVFIRNDEIPRITVSFSGLNFSVDGGQIQKVNSNETYDFLVYPSPSSYFVSTNLGVYDIVNNLLTINALSDDIEIVLTFKKGIGINGVDDCTSLSHLFDYSDGLVAHIYNGDVPMEDKTVFSGSENNKYLTYYLNDNISTIVINAYMHNSETGKGLNISFSNDNTLYTKATNVTFTDKLMPQNYYTVREYIIRDIPIDSHFIKINIPNSGSWYTWSVANAGFYSTMNVSAEILDNYLIDGDLIKEVDYKEKVSFHVNVDSDLQLVYAFSNEIGELMYQYDELTQIITFENITRNFSFYLYFKSPDDPTKWSVSVVKNEGFTINGDSKIFVNNGQSAIFNILINQGYKFVSTDIGDYDSISNILTVYKVPGNCLINFIVEPIIYNYYTVSITNNASLVLCELESIVVKENEQAVFILNIPSNMKIELITSGKYDALTHTLTIESVSSNMIVKIIFQTNSSDLLPINSTNLIWFIVSTTILVVVIGAGIYYTIKGWRKREN